MSAFKAYSGENNLPKSVKDIRKLKWKKGQTDFMCIFNWY